MAERTSVPAYPLAWPDGWPRTKTAQQSKFKTTLYKAQDRLTDEVARMGGTGLVVSSNGPLRRDGKIYADADPQDAGVAVYFQRKGKSMVFACDRYGWIADNLHALALTIEALRGIERWGASEMMERAFSGFKQLAAENEGMSWWKTLQVGADATTAEIDAAYKKLAKFAHPDMPGGSEAAMGALNVARDQGLNVAKHRSGR